MATAGRFAEELASLCDLGLPLRVILDMARLSDEQLDPGCGGGDRCRGQRECRRAMALDRPAIRTRFAS